MKNNIGLVLTKRALINANREAYVDSKSGQRLTFAELNARSNKVAHALIELGVKPGDRVALMMMNCVEFLECYFALAKIGGVVVPLNWRLVADELEFIINDSGSELMIFGEEFVDVVADLHGRTGKTAVKTWVQVAAKGQETHFSSDYEQMLASASSEEPAIAACDDDLLFIMYTSGTTGLPKGVMQTHSTTMWAIFTFITSADYYKGDRYLAALPLFHIGSLLPVTINIHQGVTSVVMREFDPLRAWQLIQEEKINVSLLVPAMLNFMIQVPNLDRFDYSTLRWIQCGASPVPVSLIQQYADMGIEIHQIYGLTESCGPGCMIGAEDALSKIGSTGRAFFHTDLRIVNDSGEDCGPDEQGEVWLKGLHMMKGYWNRPEATAETLTQEGWLRTGDVAVMDEEGFVYIQDRIKDMIISGGENVYPAEIENVILSHPGVADVAVIGQPSERWGESPFAVVVRREESLAETDVLQFCDGKMARFKLPKGAVFVEEIPRNPSGKVLKRILREQYPGPASS